MPDPEESPLVIAFDGSAVSQAGVRSAAALFSGRRALVVSVWEPGLAALPIGSPEGLGPSTMPPDPRLVDALDTVERNHATQVAEQGATLARELGLRAEPMAVADDADVADTILRIAESEGAAAVVIGSHGVSGLRSHILGSVARKLLKHTGVPVVVVRDHGGDQETEG